MGKEIEGTEGQQKGLKDASKIEIDQVLTTADDFKILRESGLANKDPMAGEEALRRLNTAVKNGIIDLTLRTMDADGTVEITKQDKGHVVEAVMKNDQDGKASTIHVDKNGVTLDGKTQEDMRKAVDKASMDFVSASIDNPMKQKMGPDDKSFVDGPKLDEKEKDILKDGVAQMLNGSKEGMTKFAQAILSQPDGGKKLVEALKWDGLDRIGVTLQKGSDGKDEVALGDYLSGQLKIGKDGIKSFSAGADTQGVTDIDKGIQAIKDETHQVLKQEVYGAEGFVQEAVKSEIQAAAEAVRPELEKAQEGLRAVMQSREEKGADLSLKTHEDVTKFLRATIAENGTMDPESLKNFEKLVDSYEKGEDPRIRTVIDAMLQVDLNDIPMPNRMNPKELAERMTAIGDEVIRAGIEYYKNKKAGKEE